MTVITAFGLVILSIILLFILDCFLEFVEYKLPPEVETSEKIENLDRKV